MTLGDELKERGLVELVSGDVNEIFKQPRTAYLGIDPTADSIQVGNLAVVLLMKRLALAGTKLVFLVGGGTGMIGDPREKGERVLLDEAAVAKNSKAIERQLKNLLGKTPFRMVNNADWLMKAKLVPFLRDVGKHFTVNDLIKRELIAKRLATPDESISYTEFTYALLQGLDYLTLHEKYGVDLEIGGTDQWTNILSGVDLVRKRTGDQVYALSMPLITDANGKKFGKSEGNAIWLSAEKTRPFAFYQFWVNLPDAGVEKYLKAYTFLSTLEIDALMELHNREPGKRQAQETLARIVTELVHGPAACAQAAAATDALYGSTPFAELSNEARQAAVAEAPSLRLSKSDLANGYPLVDAILAGGLAPSKSEARRLIEGKSITLNDLKIESVDQKIFPGDFAIGPALVRKGKRDVLVLTTR